MTMNTGDIDYSLKFGCHQLNVYNGTFKQQFIKTFLNFFSLSNVRKDVLNSVYNHVDGESQRAINRELFNRYFLINTLYSRDLPSDWVRYDGYADSEFLVHFSYVNDDDYWKHRLLLKFGCHQLNVYNGTFKQQFIKTFINLFSLLNVRNDVLNSVYNHFDEESQRAIDRELISRYYLINTLYL